MIGLFVGEVLFGHWNKNGVFFLPRWFWRCPIYVSNNSWPFVFDSPKATPIRGAFRVLETSVKVAVGFCDDGKVRTTHPVTFRQWKSDPDTEVYDNYFEATFANLVGEYFRPTEREFDLTAIGYFSNNECLMLKYSRYIFRTGWKACKAPIVENIAFAERWPMILPTLDYHGKTLQMECAGWGSPLFCEIGIGGQIYSQKFTTKRVDVKFARKDMLKYNGELFEMDKWIPPNPLEIKEEPENFIPLDKDSKCVAGIEEREFEAKFYVVEIGEDFYGNKGTKVNYRSRSKINRKDFCELLEVYDDIGCVIWSMIFD
jgi:hypothetical protein